MQTRNRRGALAVLLVLALSSLGLFGATPASADTIIPIHWNINASTHLKSLNMDVVVPQGTFDGQVNLTTGALTGNLSLPKATQTIKIFGFPIASATFSMNSAGPMLASRRWWISSSSASL